MDRRGFLRCVGCGAAVVSAAHSGILPGVLGGVQNAFAFSRTNKLSSVEARHYVKLDGGGIECRLCPRRCRITDVERGYCGVRENRRDTYYTLIYGRPCAIHVDPIEKKPLYHFRPGITALSLATAGCNVNCKCCQNWEISQSRPEQTSNFDLPPGEAVALCKQHNIPSIAYTYSEPTVFYEYMYDIAEMGHRQGIASVMITGGYIEEKPLIELLPHLDAVKIDLKAIRPDYYKDFVDGELQPVLDTIVRIKNAGTWLELVYLVIPTINDTDEEFRELAVWIKNHVGDDVPLHFSRFHPQYLLNHLPPTPLATLERAYDICRAEGLKFVYLGNIPGHAAESTYCPGCGHMLIERTGFSIRQMNISSGRCPSCQISIPGVF